MKRIDVLLQKLIEHGFFEHAKRQANYLLKMNYPEVKQIIEIEEISMHKLEFAFILYVIGIGFSILVFLTNKLLQIVKEQRKSSITTEKITSAVLT